MENRAPEPRPCPSCGYCPTCGHRPTPNWVGPYWNPPYWVYPTTWTITGGSIGTGSPTIWSNDPTLNIQGNT